MSSTSTKVAAQGSGHAAHSKTADSQEGLKGKFHRPINVTFLGAGSGFCPTLCRDVLLIPGADRGEFRLVDIDKDRLSKVYKVIQTLIKDAGREDGWTVRATTNRREVLPGTDYAICCVEVSGTACVAFDNDIPLKYGVDQCIGDTIGPGGLFKGLRTIPVFLDILRDMRDLCPNAIVLNYTNPMSSMVLSAGRAVPEVPVIGLCHSVQGTSHLLARYAEVPYEEMQFECAGINHLAWFTKLAHKGEDLYQKVLFKKFKKEVAQALAEAEAGIGIYNKSIWYKDLPENKKYKIRDVVRKDMCLHFGAFITESSGHLSEYLPYYRKSAAGRKYLRLDYEGGSRFYASNWPSWRKSADEHRVRLATGREKVKLERSWEYGSFIIEAREKDCPVRVHGNMMNHANLTNKRQYGEAGKLISNLPGDGVVEVACMIDNNGVHPTRYGALPPQMAHICASNMAFFDLAARAAVEKSVESAIHALLLDPLCAAVCTPAEIKAMTLEMFKAEKKYLPGYK